MTAPITQVEAYAAEIRALKQDLSAKTSDFDAALRKISALRDEVEDFQAACKSACEQRDDLAARVTALQAAVDSKADWRPPARVITDQRLIAAEATGTILRSSSGDVVSVDHGGVGEWVGQQTRLHLLDFQPGLPLTVGDLEQTGDDWTVLYVPTEEARDGE